MTSINSLPDEIFNLIYSYIEIWYILTFQTPLTTRRFYQGFEIYLKLYSKKPKIRKILFKSIKKYEDNRGFLKYTVKFIPKCHTCDGYYKGRTHCPIDIIDTIYELTIKKCCICLQQGCLYMISILCGECAARICDTCIKKYNNYIRCPYCKCLRHKPRI